jgi:geranylgeranyl pyrophosphate synthase
LISACTEAGAQSSDATPEQIEQMRQFGGYLGLIFQIKVLSIIKKKNQTHNDLTNLAEIVQDKGGFKYAEEKMLNFKELAIEKLDVLNNTPYLESLKKLACFVIDRNT